MIDGKTRLIAHIGYPTESFKSPMIYNPWFEARKINAAVIPMGCKIEDYASFLKLAFRLTNVDGALITMPHKVTTLDLVDEVSVSAKIAGACNAVRRRRARQDDRRHVRRRGFCARRHEERPPSHRRQRPCRRLRRRRVCDRGLAGEGRRGQARPLRPFPQGMNALAERLRAHYPKIEVTTGSADPAGYDIVVNATPLGMKKDDPLPFDVERIAPSTFVGEVVMKEEITPFLAAVRARGLRLPGRHRHAVRADSGLSRILRLRHHDIGRIAQPCANPLLIGRRHGRSSNMILSIATVSIGGALDEKLKTSRRPASRRSKSSRTILPASMVRRATSPGCAAISAFASARCSRLATSRDCPSRSAAQAFRRAEKKFDLMGELGTDLLLVCSNVSPRARRHRPRRRRSARTGRARGQARPACRLRGAGLGPLCQRLPGRLGDRAARQSSCDRHHPRQLPHARAGFPVSQIAAIPADKIFLVQLADAPQLDLDVLSWSRHFRCFPGQGNLPVRDFMQAIDATGYKGPLSLEIFNDQFRAQSTREVALDGMRSLLLMGSEQTNAAPRCAAGESLGYRLSSSSPSTAPMPSRLADCFASSASPDRPSPLEGGRALVARRYQSPDQLFRRQLCQVALHDPRFGRLRDRAASRRRRRPHEPGRRAARDDLPASRSGPAK